MERLTITQSDTMRSETMSPFQGLDDYISKPLLMHDANSEEVVFDATDHTKEIEAEAVRMVIPREHLFGIKERSEYQSGKRKALEKAFKKDGNPTALLEKHPIVVCAVPIQETGQLLPVIVNGHHRTRVSGKYGLNKIPCEVYSPEQLAHILNSEGEKIDGRTITPQGLTRNLLQWTNDATRSFRQVAPDYTPLPIQATNIHEMQAQLH